MVTNTPGSWGRQDPRNVCNQLRYRFTFADPGLAVGVQIGVLPQNAFITGQWMEIVTAFNAGGTNPISVGTVGAAYNNIVAAADVNPALAGVYPSTRAVGRALTAAAEVLPVAKYTQTGTAATQGQAITVIGFEGGWAS